MVNTIRVNIDGSNSKYLGMSAVCSAFNKNTHMLGCLEETRYFGTKKQPANCLYRKETTLFFCSIIRCYYMCLDE